MVTTDEDGECFKKILILHYCSTFCKVCHSDSVTKPDSKV